MSHEHQVNSALVHTVLDTVGQGIVTIDSDGIVRVVNRPALEMWGYREDEVLGQNVTLLMPAELAPHHAAGLARYLRTRKAVVLGRVNKVRGRRKDGTEFPLEVRLAETPHGDELLFTASLRDLTQEQAREQALRERLEFEDLVMGISARFIRIARDQVEGGLNDALRQLGEYARTDRAYLLAFQHETLSTVYEWRAPGTPERNKPKDWPDDRLPVLDDIFDAGEQAAMLQRGWSAVDDVSAHPPGRTRTRMLGDGIKSTVIVPMVSRGVLIGCMGFDLLHQSRQWDDDTLRLLKTVGYIFSGVIERGRAEDELLESYANLERKVYERTRELREKQAQLVQSEKMAALGNLVAGVAHEINTPLGAIKSSQQTLIRGLERLQPSVEGDARSSRVLSTLNSLNSVNVEAVDRIQGIVDSLRKFARLDEAERDTVDLLEGLETTLKLVHHQLKHGIQLHKDFQPLPQVECYPNRINQVFMNLLVNAAQAMGGKGDLYLSTRSEGDWVTVEVRDTGVGIEAEKLSRVFDPGYTTKGVGVGTGLGLSIALQIVRDHGGSIEVDSTPGQGSTFRLMLPVRAPEQVPSDPPLSPAP